MLRYLSIEEFRAERAEDRGMRAAKWTTSGDIVAEVRQ